MSFSSSRQCLANMLCRVLLAAIGISYLVCVLFLSGIQKEDLEVSLLKKMQHYNINYDKNNQELRKECLSNSNSTNNKADRDNKTTETTAITTISTPSTLAAILDTRELQSVLKYLKHKKKIRNPPTTEPATWKTSENIEKGKRLFETIMSENNENIRKPHSVSKSGKKESALDDINQYLLQFTDKLNPLISQTSNKIENRTSVDQMSRNKDDATQETVKMENGLNILQSIEQIGKALAEYLSKKSTVPTEITTVPPKTTRRPHNISLESEKMVTEQPRIISQDIEQKFALGIAAINKLNENIAFLQNNINDGIFFKSNTSNQSKGSIDVQFKESKNNQIRINEQEKIENSTKQFSDGNDQTLQPVNTMYMPKLTEINKYKYRISNPAATPNFDANIQVQSDPLQNSQSGFAYTVNNSLNSTLPSRYVNSKLTESFLMTKSNPNQPTPISKDMVASSESYNKEKLPNQVMEQIYPVGHSSKSIYEMDQHSQKIKEITNYSYEKETNPEIPNVEQNIKVDTNDPMVYIPRPQILPNVINYGYYNTKQPTNMINNFKYNVDAIGNGVIQGENQDIPLYNSDTKIVQDEIHVPIVENNADIYKKSPMQYHDPTQLVQESIQSVFAKQAGLDTQVIDIQSIIDILKKKKLPLSIQNVKDTLTSGYYDSQKGPTSHILNRLSSESLFNTDYIMNKENDREPTKDPTNLFPIEMISKIAETVKEIVLKDLKEQMFSNTFSTASPTTRLSTTPTVTIPTTTTIALTSTTVSPTTPTIAATTTPTTPITTTTLSTTIMSTLTTTTATPTTTTPITSNALPCSVPSVKLLMDTTNSDLVNKSRKIDENKIQVATQTIEKFIQLFEQMKSAQEISFKSNDKKTKLLGNRILTPRYNVPVVMYPPPMNPYGMRLPKQMPIIVHNYIPPTLARPPFPPSFVPALDTKNSMSPIIRPPTYIQPRFPHAVMIQTNTQEIQPIGIPVIKPEAMNMNIIVTTQNPFWSRDASDRWNYIYKYGRKPDKKDNIKLTNSFNVYHKDKVNNIPQDNINPIENKALNKNAPQVLNNINSSLDDNMRMNIYNQFDSYNKQVKAERNRNGNEEKVNAVPLERNRYPSKNYINDSNFQDFINQMAKNNQQMFGVPYNNPMYNGYKISNINPNTMFGQLQNGGFSNQMFPYNAPDSNILNQNFKTPNSIQYSNYRDKNTADLEINNFNIAPEPFSKSHFNPIKNEQINNLHETNKNRYLKPSLDNQIHNVETMPKKDININSNQFKIYRTAQNDQFNVMPSYRVKYSDNSRPSFEHRMQRPQSHSENTLSSDGNKAIFRNLEEYFGRPNRMQAMQMREKALLKQERDNARPMYKHSQIGNGYTSLDKIKMKYENPEKYYSSPSDEDSNREFKKDKPLGPYHGKRIATEFDRSKQKGKKQGLHQPQMDLINAVFGHRNRQKGGREQAHAFDGSDTNSQDRTRLETSDVDMKGRTIQVESSDSDKYASNVRGFHEKLESSDGWTEQSDCGPNEHCISSVKILSRQQVPLDSKKPAKYDDTRFKKFLQTQEKVNRMLEMILASKPDDGVDTI